ncbi:MAG: flagellin [Acidimicrobiales bacterium]
MSSLVVDTNLSALQTLNDLNSTDNSMTTAIKRLSSGLQIQTPATGPAQYVISQALKSQSNGYNTAIQNAQNGVSMIQTAAGALTQISSILQTMNQLALTSANGAAETTTARTANNTEFQDLASSIDKIAKTTTFGTTHLLTGTGTTPSTKYTGTLQVGAFNNSTNRISLSIEAATSTSLGLSGTAASATGAAVTGAKVGATPTKLSFSIGTASYSVTLTATETFAKVAQTINADFGNVVTASVATTKLTIATVATGTTAKLKVTVNTSLGFATAVTTAGSGTAVSISTATTAQLAVTVVQKAITTVDTIASKVGATQNELQTIVSNLTVGQQNLQAANSQLVDVNMAQEMTTFSTDQILMQTGVSMLAQAQSAPQLVLKLI